MKFLLLLSLGVLSAATAFAEEQPFFQINARYEGVDPTYIAAATGISINKAQEMDVPRLIKQGGQYATFTMGSPRSVVPLAGKLDNILLGITLDVKPDFYHGVLTLYGKSVVRRQESRDDIESLHAQTFTTRETYFWKERADDKPLTIPTGDGVKDTSRIILTVKRIDAAEAARLTTPKFRVFAVEPTGQEAKNPIYQEHSIVPAELPERRREGVFAEVRSQGYSMASFYQPKDRMPRPLADYDVAKAMRELAPDEQPVKVSGAWSPKNSELLDIKLESTEKSERQFSGQVFLHWGSDIYLALADKTKPTGVRLVIIRQE